MPRVNNGIHSVFVAADATSTRIHVHNVAYGSISRSSRCYKGYKGREEGGKQQSLRSFLLRLQTSFRQLTQSLIQIDHLHIQIKALKALIFKPFKPLLLVGNKSSKDKDWIHTLQLRTQTLQGHIRQKQNTIQQLKSQIQSHSRKLHHAKQHHIAILADQSNQLNEYYIDQMTLLESNHEHTLASMNDELASLHGHIQQIEQELCTQKQQYQQQIQDIQSLHNSQMNNFKQEISQLQSLHEDTVELLSNERSECTEKVQLMERMMEKEREKANLEIQEQKIKMRKLVKALAKQKKNSSIVKEAAAATATATATTAAATNSSSK
jgi:predicted  nucleic acid-binding Zn-ribbon protein